jgi:streptomycin 6-kinase
MIQVGPYQLGYYDYDDNQHRWCLIDKDGVEREYRRDWALLHYNPELAQMMTDGRIRAQVWMPDATTSSIIRKHRSTYEN